ncbi:MAG: sensor histidine kinase [Chitinophagaceae bacterium]
MKYQLGLHILFWVAYLLFESYIEFAWMSSMYEGTSAFQRWWLAFFAEASQLPIDIPTCYFIAFLINTGDVRIKKPVYKLLLGIAAIAFAVILQRFLIIKFILPDLYHEKNITNDLLFSLPRVLYSFIDIIFVVGIFSALKQYRYLQRSKEKEKSLVKEKLVSELKFLRTQTNPHFLFNTLNNIYALARKKSDDTADVVMKLSKLLRFMLYESRKQNITIAEELKFLSDYIELERIRYNERLTIRFTRSIDDESQPIAPLILLPFVENAFKHGASETRFNSFIHIHVQLLEGRLIFTIENSKDDDSLKLITENIGLSNVRRQLELSYPEHHIDMKIEATVFKVILTLNLYQHATI